MNPDPSTGPRLEDGLVADPVAVIRIRDGAFELWSGPVPAGVTVDLVLRIPGQDPQGLSLPGRLLAGPTELVLRCSPAREHIAAGASSSPDGAGT